MKNGERGIRQRGFSLLELSIIIGVIALTTTAIIGGRALIDNARLSTAYSDISQYIEMINQFEETYGGLPGDLHNASSFFAGAQNGDGNGRIEDNSGGGGTNEPLLFWQHLSMAGLLPDAMDGATTEPGVGLPRTDFGVSGLDAGYDPQLGLIFELTGYQGTTGGYSALTPEDAMSLDEKYDDGDPTTGEIRAEDGSDAAGLCRSGSTYLVDTALPACRLTFSAKGLADNSVDVAKATCGSAQAGDTQISGTSCPTGMTGYIIETCQNDGSWSETHNYCSPVNCGGGVYGDTRDVSCPAGYTGIIGQQCTELGWATTSNTCVEDTSGGCANGDTRTLNCPDGNVGSVVQYCDMGNWVTESTNCSTGTCSAGSGCPAGNKGDSCTVTCTTLSGYDSGNITKVCSQNGTWESVTNNCSTDTSGSCTDGDTRSITCPNGESGTVEQECVSGSWQVTADNCTANNCGGAMPGATRPSIYSCPGTQTGTVFDVCLETGQWQPDYSNCTYLMCSAGAGGTDGNATWPAVTAGTNGVTGTCIATYMGTATRDCGTNGLWSATVTSCSPPDICDNGDTGGLNYPIPVGPTYLKVLTGTYGGTSWTGCLMNSYIAPTACTPAKPADPANGTYADAVHNSDTDTWDSTLTCATGYTIAGSNTASCPFGGSSWNNTSTCNPDACTTQSLGCGSGQNCSFGAVASGITRTASCPAGYTGSPQRTCSNGSWGALSGGCTPASCTTQSLGCGSGQNCSFSAVAHGGTRTASCPAGYTGSPQRTCSLGGWGGLSGSCVRQCTNIAGFNAATMTITSGALPTAAGGTVTVGCKTPAYDVQHNAAITSQTLTCTSSGSFNSSVSLACYQTCGDEKQLVSNPSRDQKRWTGTAQHWQTVDLSCHAGTSSDAGHGGVRYRCENGTWVHRNGICLGSWSGTFCNAYRTNSCCTGTGFAAGDTVQLRGGLNGDFSQNCVFNGNTCSVRYGWGGVSGGHPSIQVPAAGSSFITAPNSSALCVGYSTLGNDLDNIQLRVRW